MPPRHLHPLRVVALLPAALLLCSCFDLAGEPSSDEVATVTSPDGAIRALLFETGGGATTAFGYKIELQSAAQGAGNAVAAGKLYAAARSDCSWGVNLRWTSPTKLVVEFMDADQVKLPALVQIGAQSVEIVQRSGVSDDTAPCGGMLANLR